MLWRRSWDAWQCIMPKVGWKFIVRQEFSCKRRMQNGYGVFDILCLLSNAYNLAWDRPDILHACLISPLVTVTSCRRYCSSISLIWFCLKVLKGERSWPPFGGGFSGPFVLATEARAILTLMETGRCRANRVGSWGAEATTFSMVLTSSRTLPGQSYTVRARRKSGEKPFCPRLYLAQVDDR